MDLRHTEDLFSNRVCLPQCLGCLQWQQHPCLFTVVVLCLQVKAQSTCDLLRARWCEPVLSVVDIRVGDDEEAATDPFYRFGPTRFSVIPRSAVGNVSVRFVPDQVQIFPASSPGSCTCPSEMSTT